MPTATIRFEHPDPGLAVTFAVRRERDGRWLSVVGAGEESWGSTAQEFPLDVHAPSAARSALYHGSVALAADGLYAARFRYAAAGDAPLEATRYLELIDGSDGVRVSPSEPHQPFGRGSDAADVLLAIRERLVEAAGYGDAQAEISLVDEADPDPIEGASFVRVCPLGHPYSELQDGAGRHATECQLPFMVRVFRRKASDRAWVSRRAVAGEGGLLRQVRQVIDALQQYIPADAAACPIVTEPIRLASEDRPMRYRSDSLWYRGDIQFVTGHYLRFGNERECALWP